MVFEVQRDGSQVNVLVIHTDEELEIARRTLEYVRAVKS
jgi:acetate kinase